MKTEFILLSTVVMVLTGCSSLNQVHLEEKETWMPRAQQDLLTRDATVTTRDGSAYEGRIIGLNSDTLWLQAERSMSPDALEVDRVSFIRPSRNVGAPLGGFLGGLVIGALAGGAIGANEETEYPDLYTLGLERFGNAAAYGLIGAGVGGVVFGVTLGLATSVSDYQVLYGQPRKKTPGPGPAMSDSARIGR